MRLWLRLTLAFAVVIAVAVGTAAALAALRTGEAFRLYLSYGSAAALDALADTLAEFYEARGGWAGVEQLLDDSFVLPGHMMGRRRTLGFPLDSQAQIVLADSTGQVFYERPTGSLQRHLTPDEAAGAVEVTVGGAAVGKLVVALPIEQAILGPLEERFFARLREYLVAGGLMAAAIALLLGLAFSRSLSIPLQRLAEASRSIAERDFGQRVHASGTAEIVEVAEAFNEMASGLEKAEQLRRDLVADVAHELRTPLSVLQGNLRALLDGVYPLTQAEVAQVYDQTRLLSRLVDDLRELALADAGQLRVELVPTHLEPLLQSAVEKLSTASDAHGVDLLLRIPDALPQVDADADRVAQIIGNLLVNALGHTPDGGRITVAASAGENNVQVTVSDSGQGIPVEHLDRVFDRFWRSDPSRTRDRRLSSGTGLGLSIVQALVRAQNGRIWVESKPGLGTSFHFTLPRHAGP